MENSTIQLGSTVVQIIAAQQRFRPAWPFGPWLKIGEGSVHAAQRRCRPESGEPAAWGAGNVA
jgi:hypothetical protein